MIPKRYKIRNRTSSGASSNFKSYNACIKIPNAFLKKHLRQTIPSFFDYLLFTVVFCLLCSSCGKVVESPTANEGGNLPVSPEIAIPRSDSASVRFESSAAATTPILQISWETLAQMDFEYKYVEEINMEVPYPVFSEEVKNIEGRKIEISGYLIPVSETGDNQIIVLSAFPYSQCFFCGAAGPESVIDVLAKEPLGDLKMDQLVTFQGVLKLNDSDLDYLNYLLDDAILIP